LIKNKKRWHNCQLWLARDRLK
jgi:hypothetical protein